jgi:hypothetical protein
VQEGEQKKQQRKRKSEVAEIIDAVNNMVKSLIEWRYRSEFGEFMSFLLLLLTLYYFAQFGYPTPVRQVLQEVHKKSLTVEQVMSIIRQCEKSKEPFECVKNALLGG